MTSYFDERVSQINEAASVWGPSHKNFMEVVETIEQDVIETVNLCTGDREFPDDLRQKIQAVIAMWTITTIGSVPPRTDAVKFVKITAASCLLSELHSCFHILVGRRIKTRFGYWNDSPAGNVFHRDNYDKEQR